LRRCLLRLTRKAGAVEAVEGAAAVVVAVAAACAR
jgi:hypothetical protein